VEFDHADIFRDIAHIRQTFDNFIDRIYPQNTLFAFDDDQNISDLIKGKKCCIESYGKHKDSSWCLGKHFADPPWSVFEVLKKGEVFGTFKAKLMGEHNLLNALSSIAVADSLEIPINAVKSALETFENVKRRQEIRGTVRGITVMDDFAHHPTAVRETIKGVKRFYNKGRLIAVFEPRTNSSMRSVFQDIYPLSFDNADLICIRKPPLLEKIPTGERFSSEKLVDDLKIKGKDAHYFSDTQTIIDFLLKTAKTDDVVLIMSNGGFDNIHSKLLELL
jgi:UDP-N-acetylmuramate: L-alanyl-gamma-D-glutamyl-meso-diaminopimelate ligase